MEKRQFCVYNQTRQSFLSLAVDIADTHFTSLKGLLGKKKLRNDEGLWIVPSQGIHTIGVLFPIDVVYLDADRRVIHLVEQLKPFRISPIKISSESVLQLPPRTIYASRTEIGDIFSICSPVEMEMGTARLELVKPRASKWGRRWRHLGRRVETWIAKMTDRRESKRMSLPVVAYYCNGGTPQAYQMKEVSATGGYLITPDRWYPGTVLQLTLQYDPEHVRTHRNEGNETKTLMVRAKVVRSGPDGVGIRLVHLNRQERRDCEKFLAEAQARG